ncbi:hypothetical protein IKG12_03525 [Candidatus Saccharibacteria bacterium]|nr:hypothetical protein [Candidatus Saccharibacteria bacterium]
MQRVIIVYNPRSSKQALIQDEVIKPMRAIKGYQVGKYEVKQMPVEENAKNLTKILMDGDLILVAGGDGTATVGLNAAMMTEAKVTLGVLGYGNFNDMANMLGEHKCEDLLADFQRGSIRQLYPLEARINGEFFRYAACYFSIGMFAESTEEFNVKDTRNSLKKGKKRLAYSIKKLMRWYFSSRKRNFLPPDIQLNDTPINNMRIAKNGRKNITRGRRTTDVLFVNSDTVAKMMKGGNYWQRKDEYLVSHGKLKNVFRLGVFMMKSILFHLPGKVMSKETKIDFSTPSEIEIQAEGEYKRVQLTELVVKKSDKAINVITKS